MYGCNKLYCEQLGRYYARYYKQLAAERASGRVDFRSVRFPGLISAVTVPSGGTSDYAPEMIHAAAKGEPYACFVRPDTRIPFMAMPDGVEALLRSPRRRRAPDAHRLQRPRLQPVGRRDPRRSCCARFPTRRSPGTPMSSARASSTRGRPTSTTAPPAATGASRRATTSSRAFRDYLIPRIREQYA